MKKTSKTVVFFGSGPVAAASLRKLHKDFDIEAVITKPRAPHHKGPVPVIELAEELGLKLITVESKRALDEALSINSLKSDVAILIDFGIIVSQTVIDYFKFGIINSHFSILPEWRGADPITFAILSGQKSTGVSLMLLVEKMDEGPILAQEEFIIPENYDTPQLTKALIDLSHQLLIKYVPQYLNNDLIPYSQDTINKKISYSRKIVSSDSKLDFHKSANELEREIRAFLGWPGSKTEIGSKEVIITKAHIENETLPIGKMKIVNNNQLFVGTRDKSLSIDEVRPAGKNTMSVKAFLAGNAHLIK